MTGWTFDQIDDLTLAEAEALFEYWGEHPPVHELVAAFVGLKSKAKAASLSSSFDAFAALTGGKPGPITMDMLRQL